MLYLGPPLFPPTGCMSAAEESEEEVPVFNVLFFFFVGFFCCFSLLSVNQTRLSIIHAYVIQGMD